MLFERFEAEGLAHFSYAVGGLAAWKRAGLPRTKNGKI
jgi:hypothetical protein